MHSIHTIRTQQPEYLAVLALRQKVLRAPLGLNLYEEDLSKEVDEHIFVYKKQHEIVACVQLAPIANDMVKLRQMAVVDDFQHQGIGTELVTFAEQFAKAKLYHTIILHARVAAEGFYTHLGYQATGHIFEEVGIPHIKMTKIL